MNRGKTAHALLALISLWQPLSSQASAPKAMDTFRLRGYKDALANFGEPAMSQLPDASATAEYRYLFLRGFHRSISIRIAHKKDNSTLVYCKEISGQGGYQPGKLVMDTTTVWTNEQYNSFVQQLDAMKFWTIEDEVQSLDPRYGGTDAMQWILEGVAVGKPYHYVDGWNLDKGSLRQIGIYVLTQTKLLNEMTRAVYQDGN